MNFTASIRALSIVLGALIVGLLIGYGVKASADKKPRVRGSVPVSIPCGFTHTIFVFADGISEGAPTKPNAPPPNAPNGAADDHKPTSVCDTDNIIWQVVPGTSVTGFQISFDESPCEGEGNFPAAVHNSSAGAYTCNISAKNGSGIYVHKYELIINVGNTNRYHDPVVIVSGTGTL
jgi:hypothetical protein